MYYSYPLNKIRSSEYDNDSITLRNMALSLAPTYSNLKMYYFHLDFDISTLDRKISTLAPTVSHLLINSNLSKNVRLRLGIPHL